MHLAHAFGMRVVAHDPFISSQFAADLDVELLELDELCAQADFITLHVPSTGTRPLFDAARLSHCKPTVRIINTARGTLIDEAALSDAIERGVIGGAGLDVFQTEPPSDTRLTGLPQVVATPHIAGSTREAQELVGLETATSVLDFLNAGIVRNAVNYPSLGPEELRRIQPYATLAERLGAFLGQISTGRIETVAIRYYGELAEGSNEMLVGATLVGFFGTVLSSNVTPINARALTAERGIEVIESRSTRPRNFTSLISIKLHTSDGERWAEGALFEQAGPTARTARRGHPRGAPRGYARGHSQQRPAGCHWRGRDDSGTPRNQHRDLRARPGTHWSRRGGQDRSRGRRRPSGHR